MGLDCELHYGFNFIYRTDFSNGLCEHELDHVFFGTTDELPVIDPTEVAAYEYLGLDEIKDQLQQHPDRFTAWFKIIFERVVEYYSMNAGK